MFGNINPRTDGQIKASLISDSKAKKCLVLLPCSPLQPATSRSKYHPLPSLAPQKWTEEKMKGEVQENTYSGFLFSVFFLVYSCLFPENIWKDRPSTIHQAMFVQLHGIADLLRRHFRSTFCRQPDVPGELHGNMMWKSSNPMGIQLQDGAPQL